jgi:hypothetical protein
MSGTVPSTKQCNKLLAGTHRPHPVLISLKAARKKLTDYQLVKKKTFILNNPK